MIPCSGDFMVSHLQYMSCPEGPAFCTEKEHNFEDIAVRLLEKPNDGETLWVCF